ncbi:unnamed protein product, partial [Trypanosoma congolense IL3000]
MFVGLWEIVSSNTHSPCTCCYEYPHWCLSPATHPLLPIHTLGLEATVMSERQATRCSNHLRGRWRTPLPLWTQLMRFLLVLLISTFIIAVALVVSHERMPDPKVTKPLPDLGFEIFAKVPKLSLLADLSIGCLSVLSAFTSLKLYLLHRQAMGLGEVEPSFKIPVLNRLLFSVWMCKENCSLELRNVHLIAWIRFVTSYSLLLLFRSVVIVTTELPTPVDKCQDPPKITNPLKNIILTVITAGGGSIHCGDLMFSGHTVILTLHLMFQWVYGRWCT